MKVLDCLALATDYRKNHTHAPTHIGVTESESAGLFQELAGCVIYEGGSSVALIFGMEIKIVKDDYSGVKVWASKRGEPLEKFSACGSCGAPWEPICRYCGREG